MQRASDAIARRAFAELGTPFRLHGRQAGASLDCVGLVAVVIEPHLRGKTIASDYTRRGDFLARLDSFFDDAGFNSSSLCEPVREGDILAVTPGPSQIHLVVSTSAGWVHSHAGLRRVVLSPPDPDWPLLRCWRLIGE